MWLELCHINRTKVQSPYHNLHLHFTAHSLLKNMQIYCFRLNAPSAQYMKHYILSTTAWIISLSAVFISLLEKITAQLTFMKCFIEVIKSLEEVSPQREQHFLAATTDPEVQTLLKVVSSLRQEHGRQWHSWRLLCDKAVDILWWLWHWQLLLASTASSCVDPSPDKIAKRAVTD